MDVSSSGPSVRTEVVCEAHRVLLANRLVRGQLVAHRSTIFQAIAWNPHRAFNNLELYLPWPFALAKP